MRLIAAVAALALAFATAASAMDQAKFDAALSEASSGKSKGVLTRPQVETKFAALLATPDLTPDQKAAALRGRAVFRGIVGDNKPGAVADYEAYLKMKPDDAQAQSNLAYVKTQIGYIQGRIDAAVQPAPKQADDLYQMGRWAEAHAIWRKFLLGKQSELHAVAIGHLVDDGLLCTAPDIKSSLVVRDLNNVRTPLMLCKT